MRKIRTLAIVLGDQLDRDSSLFDDFDPTQDLVWMAEVAEESTHVWSHQARIALFLSAMRHFAEELRARGLPIQYVALDQDGNCGGLSAQLAHALDQLRPERVQVVEPGDYRVAMALKRTCRAAGVTYEVLPDRHFYCSVHEFREYAKTRKQLRLEFFYRDLRRKHGVLMDLGQPIGGEWNYDSENRGTFGKAGPGQVPAPHRFPPDEITCQVLELVASRFGDHPGKLDHFDWPVTADEAEKALDDFLQYRLPSFGEYQDAMWSEETYLYHSRLSSAMNLKLLPAKKVVAAAEQAYHAGHAPLAAVEGFIRQILGWREYVRGVYWTFMPQYAERNALSADTPLPDFYWTGETDMNCLRQTLKQTLDHGYAHHIQRLMVTGLYALLLGVRPSEIHAWYLAIYVDAVEWVELPNVIGMSQFADGGLMGSKPYVASGKYIQRMSNYCTGCRYDPAQSTGDKACPFTTLYWDFLIRHEELLRAVPRMEFQLRNVRNLKPATRELIQLRAEEWKGTEWKQ